MGVYLSAKRDFWAFELDWTSGVAREEFRPGKSTSARVQKGDEKVTLKRILRTLDIKRTRSVGTLARVWVGLISRRCIAARTTVWIGGSRRRTRIGIIEAGLTGRRVLWYRNVRTHIIIPAPLCWRDIPLLDRRLLSNRWVSGSTVRLLVLIGHIPGVGCVCRLRAESRRKWLTGRVLIVDPASCSVI